MRNILPSMSWMRRSRNSVKSAEFMVPSKVIQNIAPRTLMADAMPIDSCFPRFLTTGVWPTGDHVLPDRSPLREDVVIGPAPCLICEEDLRPLPLGAFLNGRKCFLHPYPPVSLITLQCLVHRALRGEAEHLQDPADVLFRVIDPESRPDQIADQLPGPQAEIELELAWVQAEIPGQLQHLLIGQQPFPA